VKRTVQVVIESKLVIDTPTLTPLYYYCRAQDVNGQGWVVLSMGDLQEFFGKRRRTIHRWLKAGLQKQFYRRVEFNREKVYVQYVAKKYLKERTGGCVASTRVTLEVLKQVSSLKAIAYEAALIAQQERCEYKVLRSNGSTKSIYKPKRNTRRSRNVPGCDCISRRGYHFVKTSRTAIGASQITVAAKLDRANSTLRRHITKVERVSIFQGVRERDTERPGCYTEFHKVKFVDGFPVDKVKLYRRAPSYYFSDLDVRVQSSLEVVSDYAVQQKQEQQLEQNNQTIEYIVTAKSQASRSFEDILLNNFTVEKLRLLAHTILLHFRGEDTPKIDEARASLLVQMIVALERTMDKEEWQLVKFMVKRMRLGKDPLPFGTKQGDLLTHLTFKPAKLAYKTYHEHFTYYNH
jgi:hypothetical protein